MRIRYLDLPGDMDPILATLPDLYESNFPGFVADSEFVSRKKGQIRSASRDPGQTILVAEDAAGLAGFIWLAIEEEWGGTGTRGEVAALYVRPEYRGKGVGRELMAEGEAMLRRYGCHKVHLMVTRSNESAVRLYEELGYKVTRLQMEKSMT
ncbi:MAG TPA: GNAT family N-acetyltransferase [Symbiobacteriaceae bacterium]|nr:GNAT family N-acetyltransferase [Symbiobacteriaceae bacterium]